MDNMTPAQRQALRNLGARNAKKKPITKGQNLPNGGWGNQTTPAKSQPKGSGSLDAASKSNPSGKVKGYKKGGKVKKTGLAKLHKGEVVVPKKTVKGKSFKQVKKAVKGKKKFNQRAYDKQSKKVFGQ